MKSLFTGVLFVWLLHIPVWTWECSFLAMIGAIIHLSDWAIDQRAKVSDAKGRS